MKKRLALLLALVMVCATMLTACGGSKLSNTTWYLTKLNIEDIEVTAEQIEEMYGESKIEFKNGGLCKVRLDGEDSEGDWKLDGDKVIISNDGEELACALSDSELVIDVEGVKMTFTKK